MARTDKNPITIVGSGVVGTATGRGFATHGHDVTFVDISPDRLAALREDGLHAVDHVTLGDEEQFVFLTLPTPNDSYGWDLDAFVAGTRSVGEALAASDAFHTVVVRSTVPPGTTEGLVRRTLEQASGLRAHEGFGLASNPEFLRARSAYEDFLHPWMTVVASRSPRTRERVADLLRPFGGELRVFDDPKTTEMVKASHNIFNAAKISFWNEMWLVCEQLGIEADDVAGTVARSSEGSINVDYGIRGGAPYGGACLPKDTKGFLGFAGLADIHMPLLAAVDEVNDDLRADDAADEEERVAELRLIDVDPTELMAAVGQGERAHAANGHS